MIVKQFEWISEDALEAILTIGDDEFECSAFCHPCFMQVGDRLRTPLLAIFSEGIVKEEPNTPLFVRRIGESFRHEVLAEVTDIETG